jgi:DNA-binding XRE family transcriptional regulator
MVIEATLTRVRCLSVKTQFRAQKPINTAYPTSLNTLGDHLRKVQLDRGLSQPNMAKIFKVTTDTVTGGELNRNKPQARLAKKIIQFLR